MERISSNSQTLKEKFPEVYREFFSRCHTVVSIPAYFLWTGNLLSYYGGLCVMNKLPLRMYIGLSESKHNEIVVNSSYQCYSRSQQFFSNLQTDDNLIKSVNIVSNNHEKYKNLFSKKCSIQFLAEHPIGSSLFAPSLSTAGVGFALLFYNNKISLDQVNQWPSKTFEELKHNHKLGFHEIFLNIWNFVEAVRDSYSSGVSIFNALVSSSYPIVYFSENKNWYAWRLNELAALPKIPFWPIDFGIIHTGIISQSRAVVTDCKNHPAGIYYITDATNMIRKDIKNRLPNHSSLTKRMIKSKESFWSTYIQMFNALSLTNFHSLINLLSHYRSHIIKSHFSVIPA